MNPELSDIDLDKTPVAKLIMIIEAAAASKGVELPPTDKNTWAKYLGRKWIHWQTSDIPGSPITPLQNAPEQ